MALSAKQIAKLELLYNRGEKIQDICRRLSIASRTVIQHANKNGWTHGESKRDYTNKLVVKEEERMLNSDLDVADDLRDSYLRKVQTIENMVNSVLRALGTTPEEIRKTSKPEADRVFSILKNLKISSEITNMTYEGSRRALGLDLPKEKEGPDLLPIKINVVNKKTLDDDSEIIELADQLQKQG